jgi:hypothetical protein
VDFFVYEIKSMAEKTGAGNRAIQSWDQFELSRFFDGFAAAGYTQFLKNGIHRHIYSINWNVGFVGDFLV